MGHPFLPAVLCVALSALTATGQTTPGIRLPSQGNAAPKSCPAVKTGKDLEDEVAMHPECGLNICPIAISSDNGDRCIQALQQECRDGDRVMFYDASSGKQVAWTGSFTRNGRYTYAYTKEQIVVQACGIKFNSSVSVSLAIITPPESGFDIRGVTATAPPVNVTTGPTTDTLQSAATSTNAALAATLPSTTAPSGLVKNPIITLSNYSGSQYSPIQITATPWDFAQMVHAYHDEAKSTLEAIRTLCSGKIKPSCARELSADDTTVDDFPAGTVRNLEIQANTLEDHIKKASEGDAHEPADTNGQKQAWNQGAFDNETAEAQQYAVKLSTLDSAITLPNFPSRIATLAMNFGVLAGGIQTLKDTKQHDFEAIGKPQNSPCNVTQQSSQAAPTAPQSITVTASVPGKPPVTNTISIPGVQTTAATPVAKQVASASPQQLEYCTVSQFLSDYENALKELGEDSNEALKVDNPESPTALYAELSSLRNELLSVDSADLPPISQPVITGDSRLG